MYNIYRPLQDLLYENNGKFCIFLVFLVFTHGVQMGRRVAGKSLSRLYLRNCKVQEVVTWEEHWLKGVGVQHHGVTLS